MNKTELIEAVAKKGQLDEERYGCLPCGVCRASWAKTLAKKDKVQWTGFGTFELRESARRSKGVNPATGAQIDIPAFERACVQAGQGVQGRFRQIS